MPTGSTDRAAPTAAADLPVELCGMRLSHPVINGSGTFDALAAARAFGAGLLRPFPFAAFVSKTITLAPRAGNSPPRLWEAPAGLINSIGLPNKGLAGYLERDLPALADLLGHGQTGAVPLITNVMGSTAGEVVTLVEALAERGEVAAIELNVSCPNVKTGLDLGSDPRELAALIDAVRPLTDKPLIVKLTPNTADVPAIARAAQHAGADAVSLINTLRALAIDPFGRRWLGGGTGGLSGPAIRHVALAQVAAVAEAVSVPVIGMGGVEHVSHARALLDAGARIVAVGTASFRDPAAAIGIARGLEEVHAATKALQTA